MNKTFALAAAAFAAIATPAMAGDIPTATVNIADLDLTQRDDQRRLESRVETVARQICRTASFDAVSRKLERECRAAVTADAAPKIAFAIAAARETRLATIELGPNA